MMKQFLSFVMPVFLAFQSTVMASSASSVEDVYDEFLFTRYGQRHQDWSKMEPEEFREIYGEAATMAEGHEFWAVDLDTHHLEHGIEVKLARPSLGKVEQKLREALIGHRKWSIESWEYVEDAGEYR